MPDWSRDGTRVASPSGQNGSEGIWVMDADGSGAHQLTSCEATDRTPCAAGDDFGPAWSADGARIAFIRSTGSDTDRPVMVMNADRAAPLVTSAGADRPCGTSATDDTLLADVPDAKGDP